MSLLDDASKIVEAGFRRGLISRREDLPVKLPDGGSPVVLEGPLKSVRFQVMSVSPDQARNWIEKANKKNRRLREGLVRGFVREMRNGEWVVNHQGVAFGDKGQLIDGQHRLHAVIRYGQPIKMLVSTGWPEKGSQAARGVTMDTVDRGAARSVVDQLTLTHGISSARWVQMGVNIICLVAGGKAIRGSVSLTLAVAEIFPAGIAFCVAHNSQSPGLNLAAVAGASALIAELHPKPAVEFFSRLYHGHGLDMGSPILHLRNWLLAKDAKRGGAQGQLYMVKVVVNHFVAWQKKRRLDGMIRSDEGFQELTLGLGTRLAAVLELVHGMDETKPAK